MNISIANSNTAVLQLPDNVLVIAADGEAATATGRDVDR